MSNRYKRYEPTQSIIHTFDPAETFPNGTFERFLVNIINQLDLSRFENAQEDRGGETPFDPRALLGIIFYSYCNSCFSARKMEKNCEHHMGYIFVSGYNTPEHSTISRFLNKYETRIIDLFAKILYLADKSGFIDYNLIAIDGTKIKANASERFIETIEDFTKREAKLTEKIQKAIKKQKCADVDEERDNWNKKRENYEKDLQKISAFLKDAQRIKTESNSEIKQNIGDSDSRILKFKRGEYGSGYNAQAASCNSDFILAAEVSNVVRDTKNFEPIFKNVQNSVPEERRYELEKSKYLFDYGYYSAENII
jgi:transposase